MSVSKLSSDLWSVILPYAGSSNLPAVRGVNKYLKDMVTKHGVFPLTVNSLDKLARITMLFNKHNIGKLEITLNMSFSNIGPAGAQAIADALKVNTGLKVLYLYSNKICPDDAQAITDTPKANPNIEIRM